MVKPLKLFDMDKFQCIPQDGYAEKDERKQWHKEMCDCEMRRNKPGYATLMDMRYPGKDGGK